MMDVVITALALTVPLIVSGVAHMAVVKLNWFPWLKRPLHEPSFGANKTWRGLLAMPLFTVPGVFVARAFQAPFEPHLLVSFFVVNPIILGLALGLGYALAELPNSWWKRRQGVAPGQLPSTNRLLFGFIDQADSAFGCAVVYAIAMRPPLSVLLVVLLLAPAVHLVANVSLYLLGLRARPV